MELDERLVKCIRGRTKEERYMRFELKLKYFFEDTTEVSM